MKNQPKRILVAGASGAVGRRLCQLLVRDGYDVSGTTRSNAKAERLRETGVNPIVVDVFDAEALRVELVAAAPEVVVHQLTDLPARLPPELMAEASVRNARIRDVGTRNLIAAAVAAGATRMVAQSIAFVYAPGNPPYSEDDPLFLDAPAAQQTSVRGVVSLESQVLAAPLEGIVLRYGKFYGPGTGFDNPAQGGPVHIDAAADAARRAIFSGEPGIYNVVEDDGNVSSVKIKNAMGWSSDFRTGN